MVSYLYKKDTFMIDRTIKLLLPGQTGYGLMIENDAGYIDPKDNKIAINEIQKLSSTNSPIPDPLIVNVVLQKYGVENKNGRWYSEFILKREAKKYEKLIQDRASVGESDHPESSIITISNVALEIKEIWWDGNVLMGKMEILITKGFINYGICSTSGDKIAFLLLKGIRIGVSSRGVGTLEKEDGKNVVQEDYDLICWDAVMQPSTPGGYILRSDETNNTFSENIIKKENLVENQKLKNDLDTFLNVI